MYFGVSNLPFLAAAAILPFQLAILEWHRKSEFSSDRAGLLAVQDLYSSRPTAPRRSSPAVNPMATKLRVEEFIRQAEQYETGGDAWDAVLKILNTVMRTHPMPHGPRGRAAALAAFGRLLKDPRRRLSAPRPGRSPDQPLSDDFVDAAGYDGQTPAKRPTSSGTTSRTSQSSTPREVVLRMSGQPDEYTTLRASTSHFATSRPFASRWCIPQVQGLGSAKGEPGVERAGDGAGCVMNELQSLGETIVAHDRAAADHVAVAVEIFGGRVIHDVGADAPADAGSTATKRLSRRCPAPPARCAISATAAMSVSRISGLPRRFGEDRPRLRRHCVGNALRIACIHEAERQPESAGGSCRRAGKVRPRRFRRRST